MGLNFEQSNFLICKKSGSIMANDKISHFFDKLYNRTPGVTSDQTVMLQFMEKTIEKVNYCLASIYATQSLLLKKGIITKDELIHELIDAQHLPSSKAGKEALAKMMKDFTIERLLDMVSMPEQDEPSNEKSISQSVNPVKNEPHNGVANGT